MKRHRKIRNNKIIIVALTFVLILMGVGYAAFNSVLDISGTTNISGNWDIKITGITEKNIVGGAKTALNENNEKQISFEALKATFSTELSAPGDAIEYDITVENQGNLNANLNNVILSDSGNPAISFTYSGLSIGEQLNAGSSAVLTVRVEYNNWINEQPENTSSELTVTLEYNQFNENDPVDSEGRYTVTWDANGGTTTASKDFFYDYMDVDLNVNTAEKEGYEFLGWNTDKNATEGLEYFSMPSKNVTLYAIYEESTAVKRPHLTTEYTTISATQPGEPTGTWSMQDIMGMQVYKSSNSGMSNSTSELEYHVHLDEAHPISFEWAISSDDMGESYAYYTITGNDGMSNERGRIQGNSWITDENSLMWQTENFGLDAGDYTIKIIYYRGNDTSMGGGTEYCTDGSIPTAGMCDDGSIPIYDGGASAGGSKGLDAAYVRNFRVDDLVKSDTLLVFPSGCENGYSCKYTINGTEYDATSGSVKLELENGTELTATTVYDGITKTFSKFIDTTPPTLFVEGNPSMNSATVVATATEDVSTITKYEFKIGNGKWIDNGTNNTYIFNNLEKNTNYDVKVRVTNSAGLATTVWYSFQTEAMPAPTFSETLEEGISKVTITYPEGCGSEYTCSYVKNDDWSNEIAVTDTTVELSFAAYGTVTAIVQNSEGNRIDKTYNTSTTTTLQDSWQLGTNFVINDYNQKIKSLEFVDNKNVPDNAEYSWDVSREQNEDIMAWVIKDTASEDSYNLYIGSPGGVKASSNLNNFLMSLNLMNLENADLSSLDTSEVTDMSWAFANLSSLKTLDLSGLDTSKVTDMNSMFSGCSGLTTLSIDDWNTSNVTNMNNMFNGCSSLTTLSLNNWDTSKVTDMGMMFYECSALTTLNIDSWDTGNVTFMAHMFNGCSALTTLNIGNWNTTNVTNMYSMFYRCNNLMTLNVNNWNTGNVIEIGEMFKDCSALTTLDLSSFDTSSVTSLSEMFSNTPALTTIYVGPKWNVDSLDTSTIFNNCGTDHVTLKE